MSSSHVRSQIWDTGMNGPWNDDSSVRQVTTALDMTTATASHFLGAKPPQPLFHVDRRASCFAR